MKTKITTFLMLAVASILALSTASFAEAGFYEKDHVRGFISIGGDYRGMMSEFSEYVNHVAFQNFSHLSEETVTSDDGTSTLDTLHYGGKIKYSKFNDYYLGLHVNVGAQYKQFLTWLDFNFMPPQVSERPSKTYTASAEVLDSAGNVVEVRNKKYPLYDVEWFTYGVDWMFGWKLFGENTVINLIPSVGFGMNLINFHFASNFDVINLEDGTSWETMRDRHYSTLASTVNAELELRLEFSCVAIGIYGGYRFIRYNELEVEGGNLQNLPYDGTDATGDTWFAGLRLTWIFLSDWQKKQNDRL